MERDGAFYGVMVPADQQSRSSRIRRCTSFLLNTQVDYTRYKINLVKSRGLDQDLESHLCCKHLATTTAVYDVNGIDTKNE